MATMTMPELPFEKTAYFHTKHADNHPETSVVTKTDLGDMQVYLTGSLHPLSEQAANGLLATRMSEDGLELAEIRLVERKGHPNRPKRTLAMLAHAAIEPLIAREGERFMITAWTDDTETRERLHDTLGLGRQVPEGKHTRGKRVRALAHQVLHYSARTFLETSTTTAPKPGDYGQMEYRAV